MAVSIDRDLTQGDTLALDFTIVDPAGQPVDLTGASIRWWMARSVFATPILQKTVGSGLTVTSATGGTFTVMLDPGDTAALVGTFYHEVETIDASGHVSTPRKGWIQIDPGLIR